MYIVGDLSLSISCSKGLPPTKIILPSMAALGAEIAYLITSSKNTNPDEVFLQRRPIVRNNSVVRLLSDLNLGYIFSWTSQAEMISPNGIAAQKFRDVPESAKPCEGKGEKK